MLVAPKRHMIAQSWVRTRTSKFILFVEYTVVVSVTFYGLKVPPKEVSPFVRLRFGIGVRRGSSVHIRKDTDIHMSSFEMVI